MNQETLSQEDKTLTQKDKLLMHIYFYKEVSSEAIDILGGNFYIEKVKKQLIDDGLIKKSSLKTTKKTALKAGVNFKTQSYYVTTKGKQYLRQAFPNEFSEISNRIRKYSNSTVERLVKMSDSEVMAKVAGAYIVESPKTSHNLMLSEQNLNPAPLAHCGSINTDRAEKLKPIVHSNLHRGVFFTASDVKQDIILSKTEVAQHQFTAITGVLLTQAKPYCLYHASNGFMPQKITGEEKVASSLIISYAKNFGLYPEEFQNAKITNAIFFCKNISAFAKLVLNKYNTRVPPGAAFDNSYIVPMSRNGCNIIKKFIWEPDYKDKLINYLISDYGFIKRQGLGSHFLPLLTQCGEAVFVGIDFDINALRAAIGWTLSNADESCIKLNILCYAWQQAYYDEVISLLNTDKIACLPIDEEGFDEIVGFSQRVSVPKERKRKTPDYSKHVLFQNYSVFNISPSEKQ